MNGILDRVKRAQNSQEIVELRQEIGTYNQASKKTIKKFKRIADEKLISFYLKGERSVK